MGHIANSSAASEKYKNLNCSPLGFRCLYPHTDYDFVEGPWKEVNEEPDCDIVETQCRNENSEDKAFDYSYVHAQIYRRPEYKFDFNAKQTLDYCGMLDRNGPG
jgi:hypothetical protein